jgi:hypothetical protein
VFAQAHAKGNSLMTILIRTQHSALDDLDYHWGEAYDLAVTSAGWVAKRLDNCRSLVAAGPDELRDLIVADYEARPVPHGLHPSVS